MAVTASMVKELREMTGFGMMDCKKALTAVDGDMDKAIDFLRELEYQRKWTMVRLEGTTKTLVAGNKAVVVEVNTETDFISRNAEFQAFAGAVAAQALNTTAADIDAFKAEPWAEDTSLTVNEALYRMSGRMGEKLDIGRFTQMEVENGIIVDYVHGDGRISVLVKAETAVDNEAVREAVKNIAMQIAVLRPQYLTRDEVSDVFLAHERARRMNQILNDPRRAVKSEKVKKGMIEEGLSRELEHIVLMDEVYMKAEDGKQSVADYLRQVSGEVGSPIILKQFIRYELSKNMRRSVLL